MIQMDGEPATRQIKWNFTKFLIDRNAVPVKRFATKVTPAELVCDIEKELQ